jgi:hypothetical protein
MSDSSLELRPALLLSVQQALLGMVTPDLRAVEMSIDGQHVCGRFAYDGEVTAEHEERVREMETLVIADLEDDVIVRFKAASVPRPEPVSFVRGTVYCFLRSED